ncbi:uncharacterized protein LOC121413702 [Lytechinus variegatus]|uniref:uncharacterized protein LOC121413702 n=1 Tax=Lytechinus variegatus TaxID=7654 RepID=UPI001BB11E67|nr:uncharacterized protein LOC121413702 [Lytechinus variegatus]
MFTRRQKIKYVVLFFIVLGFCNYITEWLTSDRETHGKRKAVGDASDILHDHAGDINHLVGARALLNGSYQSIQEQQGGTVKPTVRKSKEIKPVVSSANLTYVGDIYCQENSRVIALVSTLPHSTELRQAIRETWGKVNENRDFAMQVVFVTGNPIYKAGEEHRNGQLMEEMRTKGDLLQGDFTYDIQAKTTLPVMYGLSWILDNCKDFQYVVVVNEQTAVMPKKLFERLDYCEKHGVSDSRTWMGKIVSHSKVQRLENGLFYVSHEQFADEFFPPFCTDENGHVITKTVAKQFLESAVKRSSVVPIADVFISIISKERNWTLVEDDMFTRNHLRIDNICASQSAVTMHIPKEPTELIAAWKKLGNKTMLKECMDPDLDLVLPANVDNRPYLDRILSYKFTNPHVCYDREGKPLDIFMIVLISTPPNHGEVRKAIRETWCGQQEVLGETIRCVFILGEMSSETDEMRYQLRQEDIKYGDLVRASFQESFQNLTLKVVLGLKWISENCRHTKYFYKGDEDMFVNFNNIISYIKGLESQNRGETLTKFFVGSRMYSSIRFSPNIPEHKGYKRYHVPDKMYFGHFYPPYCSGGGYVLSAETVPDLYQESLRTSLINVDDAFQGILTKRLGYGPIGNSGFKNWGGKTDTCSLRDKNTMTIHGIGKDAKNLYNVWNTYNAEANCTDFGI